MLKEYNVGDLIRVRSIKYLTDKFKWEYDKQNAVFYLDTPSKFTRNMMKYCNKEGIIIRNIGDLFYLISFDGHVSHYCFDAEVIYKDNSNYHQIRKLSEGKLAGLLEEVSKVGYHTMNEWYRWLKTGNKVKEI